MRVGDISKILSYVSTGLAYLGAVSLLVLMFLTTLDVGGRFIFNKPILGAHELTEIFVLVLIFSFLAHTQAKKGHINVDLVVNTLSSRIRLLIDFITTFICLVLMALIAWMSFYTFLELKEAGEASYNLGIPAHPQALYVVIGCIAMCLEYFRDLLPVEKKKGR